MQSTRRFFKACVSLTFSPFKEFKPVAAVLMPLLLALAGNSALAQAANEWTHLSSTPADKVGAARWVQPLRGELFRLDHAAIRTRLASVVQGEPSLARAIGTEIGLPMPDGTTARFTVVDAPVMAPELAAKFPEIKTYAGQGIDDPSATVRLDISPAGFHAQVLSPTGAIYVDPAYLGDAELHVSYFKRDHKKALDEWHCFAEQNKLSGKGVMTSGESSGVVLAKVQSGGTLRTYRLAVAATGEYTTFHGGTVALGQAAIVTAINRINGVFEPELAVRLTLVANNNLLVFTNSVTDPYTNSNGNMMLGQNQTTVDSIIGTANYDIGHVFSTGGGGIALSPSICANGAKAQGVTGNPSPTGDSFWIDFVAHEIGHQFGADHTFNSADTINCSPGTRAPTEAYEPGSGSTIMAYAGTCSFENLQLNSEPYFHAISLDRIQSTIASSGGCATTSGTGNTAPAVNAGSDYTIPALTPFMLTATGSDANADPLTYCWEEMDLGPATSLTDPDNGSSPLFRSFNPTNTPVRYFPKLSSVLANTNWNQELLPTLGRTMKFRVTSRDNRVGGGGVADDEMLVMVVGGTGPFVVTSPNTSVTWSNTHTVTWSVAGTTAAPINASNVNIHLSTDGGLTFPYLLATNTPNDGSESITLPGIASTTARIRVQGAGNIFYDISDVNFTILANGPFILFASRALLSESCTPTNGAVDPYESVTFSFALTNLGNAPTTNLVATLLASNGVYYPSAPQNYGAIPPAGLAARSFSFIPSGACGGSVTGVVSLADGAANLGTVTQVFQLGAIQPTANTVTQVFANLTAISIPGSGNATPYPLAITVSGVAGAVVKATVTVSNITHTYPDDIDMLLVRSSGSGTTNVFLMGDCGSGSSIGSITNVTITFDDTAGPLPDASRIAPGTYRPTDYATVDGGGSSPSDPFTAPAPTSGFGSVIAPLATSPNGTWSLYVLDDTAGDSGSIGNGWLLTLISTATVTNCCNSYPPPSFTSTTFSNSAIAFSWTTLPGLHYQVESRTNLTLGAWVNYGAPFLGTGGLLTTNNLAAGVPMQFYRVSVGP